MATTTSAEFEKATDYQFKEEDIERAKALVGRWSPVGAREFLTTATPDAMRNFARGYGDDNPLFISEEYGTATRWGGQIAAPMIPIALNRPLYGDPHTERIKRPSFRGIHVFVSGSAWQWFRPLQEGDGLYSFGGTESVVEKKSEFAERSLLTTYTSVKMNQRAEIVAISRMLAIYTERKTAGRRESTPPSSRRRKRRLRWQDRRRLRGRGAPGRNAPPLGGRARRRRAAADGEGAVDDDGHDRLPCRRLRLRPLRALRQPHRVQEPSTHRALLREERVRRSRRGPARALGQRVGPGHRQPDGLRLRGDARLLAQPLHDRLHRRRRLAGVAVHGDP